MRYSICFMLCLILFACNQNEQAVIVNSVVVEEHDSIDVFETIDTLIDKLIPQNKVKVICELEESYDDQKKTYLYSAMGYSFNLKVFGDGTWPDAKSANSVLYYKNKKLSFDDCKITCFDNKYCEDYAFNILNSLNNPIIIDVCGKKFLYSDINFSCNGIGCGCVITMIYDLENNKATFLENYRIHYDGFYISDFDNDSIPDLLVLEQTSRIEKDSVTENSNMHLYRYKYSKGAFIPVGNKKTKEVCMVEVKTEHLLGMIEFVNTKVVEKKIDSSWFSTNVEPFSYYSPEFLKIKNEPYFSTMKLKDDKVFFEGDTIIFPNDLELNKTYEFKADSGVNEYVLKVKRINYTTVSYTYFKKQEKAVKSMENGLAHLGSFFLAAEVIEDSEDGGLSFGANEYFAKNDFTFCIGIGKDKKGKLRTNVDGVLLRSTPN